MLKGEGHIGYGQVGLEHLRQHGVGETGGKRPLVHAFIPLPARAVVLFGKRLALVQRDGDAHFRFDEQVVLGEETGEQHPVPMLVGALLRQMVDGLGACAVVQPIAQLAGVGAQTAPQVPLRFVQVLVRVSIANRECSQSGAGTRLGNATRIGDGAFKLPSGFGGERRHDPLI